MQQYDVATKVLMERAAEQMLKQFLGMSSSDIELIEELPQESANLKRSDYILRVTTMTGRRRSCCGSFSADGSVARC